MRTEWDALRSTKRHLAAALGSAWEVRLDDEPDTINYPYARIEQNAQATYGGRAALTDVVLPVQIIAYGEPQASVRQARQTASAVQRALADCLCAGAGSTLSAPTGLAAVAQPTGGVLTAGTHRYVVTAYARRGGETTASTAAQAVTVGTTGRVVLTWAALAGAIGYAVHRGAAGAERLLARTGLATYTDTGEVLAHPSAGPPLTNESRLGAPWRIPLFDYDGIDVDDPATDNDRANAWEYMRVTGLTMNQIPDLQDRRLVAVVASLRLGWRRTAEVPGGAVVTDSLRLNASTPE